MFHNLKERIHVKDKNVTTIPMSTKLPKTASYLWKCPNVIYLPTSVRSSSLCACIGSAKLEDLSTVTASLLDGSKMKWHARSCLTKRLHKLSNCSSWLMPFILNKSGWLIRITQFELFSLSYQDSSSKLYEVLQH